MGSRSFLLSLWWISSLLLCLSSLSGVVSADEEAAATGFPDPDGIVVDGGGGEEETDGNKTVVELGLPKKPKHYEATVTFRNELSEDVDLYWEGSKVRVKQDGSPIESHGGEITFQTFPGHVFSYDRMGVRYFAKVPENSHTAFVVLMGNLESILVECTTTSNSQRMTEQPLTLAIKPSWSPRGASRFLDLVREEYFDGVAVHRVVKGFLGQFGIAVSDEQREQYREKTILDDPPPSSSPEASSTTDGDEEQEIPTFKEGTLSFAGIGPDSRTTEVFVVMPGASQYELDEFGENSWETPFGEVLNLEESPVAQWYSYGDMPPWGKGPDPEKIYEKKSYDNYLKKQFPKLDYFEHCVVINEVEEEEEEEL